MGRFTYSVYNIGLEKAVNDFINENEINKNEITQSDIEKFVAYISNGLVIEKAIKAIFSFNYGFYSTDENIKNKFERDFVEYFIDSEIAFETSCRFIGALKSFLNRKMPYFKGVFDSSLAFSDAMKNISLSEIFTANEDNTRKKTGEDVNTLKKGTSTTETSTVNSENRHEQINSDYPQATFNSAVDYATTSTDEKNSATGDSTNTTENTGTDTATMKYGNTENETKSNDYKKTIDGYSGKDINEIVEKFRETVVNINDEIFKLAKKELFLKIW